MGGVLTIPFLQQLEPLFFCSAIDRPCWKKIAYGFALRTDFHHRPLMHRWQESGSPIDDATWGQATGVWQDDELGEVVGFTPQREGDPGTHGGKARLDETAVHHEHRWSMQRRFALHRSDQGQIVRVLRHPGKKIRDPKPGLSSLAKLPKALGMLASNTCERLLSQLGIKGGSMQPFQFRLVIPCVDMTESARAEDFNHLPGARRMVQAEPRVVRAFVHAKGIAAKHRRAGERSQSTAKATEPIATRRFDNQPRRGLSVWSGGIAIWQLSRHKQTHSY